MKSHDTIITRWQYHNIKGGSRTAPTLYTFAQREGESLPLPDYKGTSLQMWQNKKLEKICKMELTIPKIHVKWKHVYKNA